MQKVIESIEHFSTEDIHHIKMELKNSLSQWIDLRKQEINIQKETPQLYKERSN